MIRFGMALMEMIEQLTRGFVKVTGRQPDNLEKLKIQQEAVQRFKDMNKVVDMQGRTLDPSKPIMGGTQEGIMKTKGAKPKKQDPEDMAQGGRAGFKDGMSRRKFMQIMGGLAALPIVGKFFKAGKVAAPAVEAVKETVTQAPPYFFDLVNKIKLFGKQSKVGPRERVNEFTYTGKDGSDYVMTEDIVTGDIKITKDKLGGANYGDISYDTIEDRTEMVFRKGQMDESTKGKKPPNEYEEYKVEFDQDGTAADATDIDEISKIEIIKEVSDEAPSIKKAGGGIARMLGE